MPVPTPEQIDEYEAAPMHFLTAIEGLTEAQLHHMPAENEWSIHNVVIHMPDSETFGYERLRKTTAEDQPALAAYDEALWAENLFYPEQNRELAMSLFRAQRASTAAFLRNLPSEAWERTAIHSERGMMSLYDIFLLYLDHGILHLQQIERIKQSL